MKIGILALQGAFIEHKKMLAQLGVSSIAVRLPEHLDGIDGLIIPGGESTTISKLLHIWQLHEPICELAKQGMAIWGTCAGAILLAKRGADLQYPGLELMDITIARNAFGRQVASFVTDIAFPPLGDKPFPAVFIRAPMIKEVGSKAETLISLDDGTIVAAKQKKLFVTSFHPELTNDNRLHDYFLQLINS